MLSQISGHEMTIIFKNSYFVIFDVVNRKNYHIYIPVVHVGTLGPFTTLFLNLYFIDSVYCICVCIDIDSFIDNLFN